MAELSPEAAERYEAESWMRVKHPNPDEFYPCSQNANALNEYLKKHRLKVTVNNLERAYLALKAEGRLLNSQGARQTMPQAEYKQSLEEHGIECFDPTFGHSLGKKWPEEIKPTDLTVKPSDAGRVRGSLSRSAEEVFPNGQRYRPSRAEWASWPPAKLKAWMDLNGYTGNIPDKAFAD
jgi:hypothetical protein